MAANLEEFKYLCTNKSEMQYAVKKMLYDSIPNSNEALKQYKFLKEVLLESNINTIFENAQREVEKLFFSSCLLKSILDYPVLITFTNPFPSLEEAGSYITEQVQIHLEASKTYQEIAGEIPVDYRDLIKSLPDIPDEHKDYLIQFYGQYIVFDYYNLFHISFKTPVTDIVLKGQYFRPDILIWLPSEPNVKIIVEISDLDDLIDKPTASEVKMMDQILEAKGFQVIRFSKDEIEADPLSKSGELLKYLYDQRYPPNKINLEKGQAMTEWKVYTPLTDEDGSVNWHVNGKQVNIISYHSTYNLYKFYDWNRNAADIAENFDSALSVLADYFEEQPTKEQLDARQCKCWKYHFAFFREMLCLCRIISSDEIDAWIEYKTKQDVLEDDLAKMLSELSYEIRINKTNSDYNEYVWTFLDGKGIARTFSDALKDALEYNMFKLRGFKIFG